MTRIFCHPCADCGEGTFDYHEGSHTDIEYKWVCDTCGIQMALLFANGGQEAQQTPTGRRCERTLALLRMRGNPHFMFIYEGCAWEGDMSGHKFHYEEHTCPTNLIQCEEIIANGEEDPHGIFEIIEEHLITGPNGKDREEVLQGLTESAMAQTK